MNEALWAPDASFVIVAEAPIPDVYQGGAAAVGLYRRAKRRDLAYSICNGNEVGTVIEKVTVALKATIT